MLRIWSSNVGSLRFIGGSFRAMHGFLYCNIDEGFGVRGVLPFDCLRKRGSRFNRFNRFKRFDGAARLIKIGKRRGVLEYRVFS